MLNRGHTLECGGCDLKRVIWQFRPGFSREMALRDALLAYLADAPYDGTGYFFAAWPCSRSHDAEMADTLDYKKVARVRATSCQYRGFTQ
jgi:hypothetical protein